MDPSITFEILLHGSLNYSHVLASRTETSKKRGNGVVKGSMGHGMGDGGVKFPQVAV
jgi:hypothetical protein